MSPIKFPEFIRGMMKDNKMTMRQVLLSEMDHYLRNNYPHLTPNHSIFISAKQDIIFQMAFLTKYECDSMDFYLQVFADPALDYTVEDLKK